MTPALQLALRYVDHRVPPRVVLLLGEERDVRVAEAAVARLPSDLGKFADGDQTLDGDDWLPRR
jgi:hypothetical protein